jgi:hypothetical protein
MTDVVIYQMRDAGGARVLKVCLRLVLSASDFTFFCNPLAELSLHIPLDRSFLEKERRCVVAI